MLVWPLPLAQSVVTMSLNWFFPSKTWFLGNWFEFSVAEIT
jgi:hypothetical protein